MQYVPIYQEHISVLVNEVTLATEGTLAMVSMVTLLISGPFITLNDIALNPFLFLFLVIHILIVLDLIGFPCVPSS